MQSDELNSDWLSPMEALDLLEARYGPGTKALLADKLKDGLIQARAELMWASDEPSLTAAWRNREHVLASSDESVERDVIVDKKIWRSSRHWQWDMENWRWPENRFVVTRRKKAPVDRMIILGLKLRKKDVLGLDKPPSKRSGKKPNYAGYANMFMVLLEFERAGKLNIQHCTKKAALETLVLDQINRSAIPNKERLDDETMRRCTWAVWDRIAALEQ